MATVLLILVVVLVLAALVFGVVSLLAGDDPGLGAAEPDGRAVPLPNNRSLTETDLKTVRFDLGWRGYRMAQVDRVLRRTAYDVGYKDEMIAVLEAEVLALREGRAEDAELLRKARESAANPTPASTEDPSGPLLGAGTSGTNGLSVITGPSIADDRDVDNADVIGDQGRVSRRDREDLVGTGDRDDAGGLPAESVAPSDDLGPDAGSGETEAARLEEARQEAATPGTLADRGTRKHGHGSRSAGKSGRSAGRSGGRPMGSTGTARSATIADQAAADQAAADRDAADRDAADRDAVFPASATADGAPSDVAPSDTDLPDSLGSESAGSAGITAGDSGSDQASANGGGTDDTSAQAGSVSAADSSPAGAPPDNAGPALNTVDTAAAANGNGAAPANAESTAIAESTAHDEDATGDPDAEAVDLGVGHESAAPPADRTARG